jgi:acyl transferase domain-containing protein
VTPLDVDYVECHGTGTALGDPIEVGALKAVLAPSRDASTPVVLGALKSNIGHLESAAGIASLIKLSLATQRRAVPPNLHFKKLNLHIDVEDFPVQFPIEATELRENKPLLAGTSSFGFGGTNAHVVIQEASASDGSEVFRTSGRSVAFLFTGQGSQYTGMGKELYESDATFRAALDRCAALCGELLPTPLLEVMFGGDTAALDSTEYAQPAIFALEYALAEMWKARGVAPAYVLGHSVGEFAAAVAAGHLLH